MSEALFDVEPAMRMDAIFSGPYRYALSRAWDDSLPRDLWIMCNASTASHLVNDPTIVRCIGFSTRLGSGAFDVGNAYGFAATKPADMWAAERAGVNIVGPDNDRWLARLLVAATGRVIVAWGQHPKPDRARAVEAIVRDHGRVPLCLGTTKAGQPRHPLMLANETPLIPWSAR